MQTRTKESRKRLHSLILLTAFTCVLLIVSTYAWFTSQKNVNISNIKAKVEVAEGLQISLDAANWTQVLDLETAVAGQVADLTTAPGGSVTRGGSSATVTYGPYTTHKNHVPTEFLPASTSGDLVNSGKELAMVYGDYLDNVLTGPSLCDESKTDASATDYAGYFAFDVFLKNLSKTGVTEDTLQLNSDSSAWVLKEGEDIVVGEGDDAIRYIGNEGSGIQNTIRVAFARYGAATDSDTTYIDSNTTASEILDLTAAQTITGVSIWEPNADAHVERIIKNVIPLFAEGTSPFAAGDGAATSKFFTRTIKYVAEMPEKIDDVYNWADSNTALAKPDDVKTVQTTSNTYKPYTDEGVVDLTKLNGDDFTIAANSVTKLRLYVYIEGQDPDCDTDASTGGGLEVNIGLTKTTALGDVSSYNKAENKTRTPAAAAVPDGGEG